MTRGREAIEVRYQRLFSETFSGSQASLHVSAIRFVKIDVAIVDGTLELARLRNGDSTTQPPAQALFISIMTKDEGRWLFTTFWSKRLQTVQTAQDPAWIRPAGRRPPSAFPPLARLQPSPALHPSRGRVVALELGDEPPSRRSGVTRRRRALASAPNGCSHGMPRSGTGSDHGGWRLRSAHLASDAKNQRFCVIH
jgi:hypothetical protein